MKVKERREALRQLPFQFQLAFAARIGERSLDKVRAVRPHLALAYPSLQRGVDLIWRYAIQQDVNFQRDVLQTYNSTSKLIPETEDEVVPDQALRCAGQAITLGLVIALTPAKSANFACTAGESMISLVEIVYEDKEIGKKEGEWQDRAVEFLRNSEEKSVTRSMLNPLTEYARGAISISYLANEQD